MYSYGPPHMAVQMQDDQHKHTFSSYVRIRDVVLKTYLGRWMIGRSGERGSGTSVLPARHDDYETNSYIIYSYILRRNGNGDSRSNQCVCLGVCINVCASVYLPICIHSYIYIDRRTDRQTDRLGREKLWEEMNTVIRDQIIMCVYVYVFIYTH